MTPRELRKYKHTLATEYNEWYRYEVKAGNEPPRKETVRENLKRLEAFLKRQEEEGDSDGSSNGTGT